MNPDSKDGWPEYELILETYLDYDVELIVHFFSGVLWFIGPIISEHVSCQTIIDGPCMASACL